MLFVRQILRTSTRVTVPNVAALQRTPGSLRLASTTGGTSTDLRSEKTNPAQNQKPDENRQGNNTSEQQSSQQNTSGNGDKTGSSKGKQ
ncbi:hypothetical protein PG985_002044 [Apiospora marii]|uniref:Uncharacterized protein n=1 Tax=Apiospora marii TaxID=335849 RepID=A0ABR1RYG2_9PEZI